MLNPPTTIFSGTLTSAAAQTGVSISGLPTTSEYTIIVEIVSLTAASGVPTAVIAVEDSVDAFTGLHTCAVFSVTGAVSNNGGLTKEFRMTSESPNLRVGVSSATLRANVQLLGGTTPNLQLNVFLV